MNAASMSALPHVFGEDASEFRPSRWLKKQSEGEDDYHQRLSLMKKSMIVFGFGSRSCIGKNIVQLELYKLWATLLRIYRVSCGPFRSKEDT